MVVKFRCTSNWSTTSTCTSCERALIHKHLEAGDCPPLFFSRQNILTPSPSWRGLGEGLAPAQKKNIFVVGSRNQLFKEKKTQFLVRRLNTQPLPPPPRGW